jgi:hypothetical protein
MLSRSSVLYCFSALLLLGCGDAAAPNPEDTADLAPATLDYATAKGPIRTKLDRLRERLEPFRRFQVAKDAGWSTQITGCMADPAQGGMGFHYGNTALIDGKVRLRDPELLLYEPQEDGRLKLVAVEYIVPFDAWTRPGPPRLLGQEFKRNEAFGIWGLHIWLWRHNPKGRFADWNPHVHCS